MECINCNIRMQIVWSEGKYSASCCPRCQIIQAHGPTPNNTFGEDYYSTNYLPYANIRVKHFRHLVNTTNLSIHPPVLDVGAGVGFFLKSLPLELRKNAAAVEPSPFALKMLREEALVPAISADIESLSDEFGLFATVTLWDVICSVTDPVALLSSIKNRMTENAILIIKTPHHPKRLFQLAQLLYPIKKGRSVLHIPAQPFHFTPYSMEALLTSCGFEVQRYQWVQEAPLSKGGKSSIKGYAMDCFSHLVTRHSSFICVAQKK